MTDAITADGQKSKSFANQKMNIKKPSERQFNRVTFVLSDADYDILKKFCLEKNMNKSALARFATLKFINGGLHNA